MLTTLYRKITESRAISSLFGEEYSRGLAIFRILFFSTLLIEVLQIIFFQEIILRSAGNTLILSIWVLSLFFMVVGFQFQLSAIINFTYVVIYISSFTDFEYHIDHVYVSTSLLAIFFPFANDLSIDALLEPDRKRKNYRFYILMTLLISVGFVYFESFFHKLDTKIWIEGLGVWLPASFPNTTFLDIFFILNQKWLVITMSHVTLVFELAFIMLIFFKRFNLLLLVLGGALDFGILLFFTIPLFATAMITFYAIFIPEKILKKIPSLSISRSFRLPVFRISNFLPAASKAWIIKNHITDITFDFHLF